MLIVAFIESQLGEGDIGNHLVGVHVSGSAGTTLNHIHNKLVVM